MIHRSFRYRLYPAPEQAAALRQFVGATRFVYNLALEQRRTFWRQHLALTGKHLNYVTQGPEVTALRHSVDWLTAVPAVALLQALRDLDTAFLGFFRGRRGYPSPRKKGVNDSFRLRNQDYSIRALNAKWATINVPKLGRIKFRRTRPMRGREVSATISAVGDSWYISFACEIEHETPANDLPAVGIDRGVVNTLALSTGELMSLPDLANLERKKRRAQRTLARRCRGSNRYRKQRRRLSRITAHIARIRADWRHKASASVAGRFGAVVIEALRVADMTARGRGKRGLNRSIRDQGWSAFEHVLAYKLEDRGGTIIKVSAAYTSQECSSCGTIDRASRESQASFACRHCGFTHHADTNAALNILRRGTAAMRAEDRGCPSVETRTFNLAA